MKAGAKGGAPAGGQPSDRRSRGFARKLKAYRDGHWAEFLAVAILRIKGFRILARRLKTPVGEIDIVARRGGLVIFVEVKKRASLTAALLSLTPYQQHRIARAAQWYAGKNPWAAGLDQRLDAIVMGRGYLPRHIKNAWTL